MTTPQPKSRRAYFFSDFVIFPFSMIAAPVVEANVSSYATRPQGYGGQVVESRSLRLLRLLANVFGVSFCEASHVATIGDRGADELVL